MEDIQSTATQSIPDLPPDPHVMDYVLLVLRHRTVVLSIILFCTLIAFGLTYIVPYTFQSESLLLPPDRVSSSGLLSALSASGALKIMKEVENPSVDLIQNILESRSLRSRLCSDSEIFYFFKERTPTQEEMLDEIRNDVIVFPDVARVRVRAIVSTDWFSSAHEKQEAQRLSSHMANLAVFLMDSIMKSQLQGIASRTYHYADSDYRLRSAELDSLEGALAAFESANGIPDIKSQTAQTITRLGELQAERDEASLKAALLERELSFDNPQVQMARAHESEVNRMVQTYEAEYRVGPSVSGLPAVTEHYLELVRQKTALEPIVKFLREEMEQQRISAERAETPITILDQAPIPEHRTSPLRIPVMGLGAIVGLFICIVYLAIRSLLDSCRIVAPVMPLS